MSSVYVETNARGRKYLKAEVKDFSNGGPEITDPHYVEDDMQQATVEIHRRE